MKKLFLSLGLFFMLSTNAQAENSITKQEDINITFLHPIFYQQLSALNNDFFYVLKPNNMYYENSKTGVTNSTDCRLQENEEYYIKLLCNNCQIHECISDSPKIHTFSLSKDKMTDNDYIISHKVFDKNNNIEFEEKLLNDGLITIPPYQ